MKQRWKLVIEYDGTDYCGWQKQDRHMSVQQALERSIFDFSGEVVETYAAGRTDAGVHAVGQVVHFDLARESTVKEVRDAINYHLRVQNHRICVFSAEPVDSEFHARFSAKKRYYCYRIVANRACDMIIGDKYFWYLKNDLDVDAMQAGAKYLEGKHDFSSFRASECQAKSPVKTIDEIIIKEVYHPVIQGKYIEVWIEAKSFLHHQVRNIVGTLKDVGIGRIKPEDMQKILDAKDRSAAGLTAPASGLFFIKVEY